LTMKHRADRLGCTQHAESAGARLVEDSLHSRNRGAACPFRGRIIDNRLNGGSRPNPSCARHNGDCDNQSRPYWRFHAGPPGLCCVPGAALGALSRRRFGSSDRTRQ
jgi:hypothetical protein